MKALRCLAVWLTLTSGLAALAALDLRGLDPRAAAPFADLLEQACVLVLLGCLAWAWLGATAVVLEALRTPPYGAARVAPRWVPSAWRRLVLGACGAALSAGVAAPALATPGPVPLTPLPPVTAPAVTWAAPASPAVAEHSAPAIVVTSGDSLWRLTAERLSPSATDADITASWHRLYRANRDVIGEDPDVIEPGERLDPPRGW